MSTHFKATIYVSGSLCQHISHFFDFMSSLKLRCQSPCSKFISNVTPLHQYTAGYRETIWGLKKGSALGSGLGKYRKWTYSEYLHSKTKCSSCPHGTMLTYTLNITAESDRPESSHVLITLLDKHKTQQPFCTAKTFCHRKKRLTSNDLAFCLLTHWHWLMVIIYIIVTLLLL